MPNPKIIHIQIPKPCNEDWDKMTPDDCGRLCMSCMKTVVDFSTLSDNELTSILINSTEPICGRFNTSQLQRNMLVAEANSFKPFYLFSSKITASFLLLQSFVTNGFAQKKDNIAVEQLSSVDSKQKGRLTINGSIIDNNTQESLIGMEISIDGLKYVKYSDAKGQFRFVLPDSFRGSTIFINAKYTNGGSVEVAETQIRTVTVEIPKHENELIVQLVRYPFLRMKEVLVNSPYGPTTAGEVSYHRVDTPKKKKQGFKGWINHIFSKKNKNE